MKSVSIVVVCHNMRRELPRTLYSLVQPYQRDCPTQYEIVVVDNGSHQPPQQEQLSRIATNIGLLTCNPPLPSPARAVNIGLESCRGDLIGVWIDGARLASPGLVRACLEASALHARAVVATLNYQLGPDRQLKSDQTGYDQTVEDNLLRTADWPRNGYGLFDIATPELRSPDAPMLESNALFMRRELWSELKGYDEGFVEPGGGVVNPDALMRAVALPATQLIRVVGEGTFHQYHGGVTTSSRRAAMELLKQGSRTYFRLRGKPLAPVREVGWIYNARTGLVS